MATTVLDERLLAHASMRSVAEDIRLRVTLFSDDEWRRQMEASHTYFQGGGEGKTLTELGLERA